MHIIWLQLVPITDAEADFVAAHGGDALEDVFEQEQPDVFSIERDSVELPA